PISNQPISSQPISNLQSTNLQSTRPRPIQHPDYLLPIRLPSPGPPAVYPLQLRTRVRVGVGQVPQRLAAEDDIRLHTARQAPFLTPVVQLLIAVDNLLRRARLPPRPARRRVLTILRDEAQQIVAIAPDLPF